jgi:predicted glycosyltransferase
MGIGHMRRNLLIAQALGSLRPASILLIAGAREVNAFGLPPGVDCLSLPALLKNGDGQYQSRHLEIPLSEIIALRGKSVKAALEAFAPDLFIVDKVPRGALGEVEPALEYLRADGLSRCVLGLRDILDDAPSVRREWQEAGNEEAVRQFYDAVWVYGDRAVYDPVREYGFSPDTAAKVRFTGYLDQQMRLHIAQIDAAAKAVFPPLCLPPGSGGDTEGGEIVLCLVGGGQDGVFLAETFAQAEFPAGKTGVIMTGPFMPPEAQKRLQQLALERPRLHVVSFVTDMDLLLSRAERVVAMGGYNTVCEILSFGKPALIVPRVKPRREQLIRAQRLHELGFVEMMHPDALNPRHLTEWLQREPNYLPWVRNRIDMNGMARLPQLMEEVLAAPPSCRRVLPSERISYHVAR